MLVAFSARGLLSSIRTRIVEMWRARQLVRLGRALAVALEEAGLHVTWKVAGDVLQLSVSQGSEPGSWKLAIHHGGPRMEVYGKAEIGGGAEKLSLSARDGEVQWDGSERAWEHLLAECAVSTASEPARSGYRVAYAEPLPLASELERALLHLQPATLSLGSGGLDLQGWLSRRARPRESSEAFAFLLVLARGCAKGRQPLSETVLASRLQLRTRVHRWVEQLAVSVREEGVAARVQSELGESLLVAGHGRATVQFRFSSPAREEESPKHKEQLMLAARCQVPEASGLTFVASHRSGESRATVHKEPAAFWAGLIQGESDADIYNCMLFGTQDPQIRLVDGVMTIIGHVDKRFFTASRHDHQSGPKMVYATLWFLNRILERL